MPTKHVLGRSPFYRSLDRMREQAFYDVMCDEAVEEKNKYYCPEIITLLMKTNMGIFSNVEWGNARGSHKALPKHQYQPQHQKQGHQLPCETVVWAGKAFHPGKKEVPQT